MNPDGYAKKTRENSNMVDLNRNFPPQFPQSVHAGETASQQPETLAIMSWSKLYPFVLSANYHSGAVVCRRNISIFVLFFLCHIDLALAFSIR